MRIRTLSAAPKVRSFLRPCLYQLESVRTGRIGIGSNQGIARKELIGIMLLLPVLPPHNSSSSGIKGDHYPDGYDRELLLHCPFNHKLFRFSCGWSAASASWLSLLNNHFVDLFFAERIFLAVLLRLLHALGSVPLSS